MCIRDSIEPDGQDLGQRDAEILACEDVLPAGPSCERRLLESFLEALELHKLELLLGPDEGGGRHQTCERVGREQSTGHRRGYLRTVRGIVCSYGIKDLVVLEVCVAKPVDGARAVDGHEVGRLLDVEVVQ